MAKVPTTNAAPEDQAPPNENGPANPSAEQYPEAASPAPAATENFEGATGTDYTLLTDPGISFPPDSAPATIDWSPAHSRCNQIEYLRERFVGAILQNPNLERFTYGNPLEKGKRADYASAGAMLAHLCDDLATDYYDTAAHIDEERRVRLGVMPRSAGLGNTAVDPE